MRFPFLFFLCLPWLVVCADLEQGFKEPPDQTRPWCYWYWISDNISREGITADLEAMARVGIGEALIGNIFLDRMPAGDIKVFSDEWWGLVEHAIREGGRVGVNIGMFNCPGWSMSGGPWIEPEQAMRYLVSSETRVRGPRRFSDTLPTPVTPFQDVAVIAYPAPRNDADMLAARAPRITSNPVAEDVSHLVDGNPDTAVSFRPRQSRFTLELDLDKPLTARHLALTPSQSGWAAMCRLESADGDEDWRLVREFRFDRSKMTVNVGPITRGPVTVSFPAVTAGRFRLSFSGVRGKAALAELELCGAARLESYVEKQLGKLHPTPLPMWGDYLWPDATEPEGEDRTIDAGSVLDQSSRLAADGVLTWDVPKGDWIIQRIGMTPTGTRNSPASPEAQGLEVDKMNRDLAKHHFDAFIGRVLKRMPAAERRAFTRVIADSYEMGSQNWTDGFAEVFRAEYGYDPIPWLAVLQGRIVAGADQSDRFLWDLRRLVADRIATEYVGGLRDLCKPHGLGLWLENYGHWGFPSEFLKYGSRSDRIGGEYWVTGSLGSIECRAASSCANTYGKPFVSAEAFTGGPPFKNAPADLKARGDWSFCEGINHFVLHVYILQPWEDRRPGVNAWFGTEFNRHNTWFEHGRTWIDYLRRCCWMLQQGTRVADVAYFIGEDTPKMTGIREPGLPPGYDFDYINAEVIENSLTVEDGLLTLPHGTTYRVLVLPPQETMRPAVLRKIVKLVEAGATVLGPLPTRSPSLTDYPRCDREVKALANRLRTGDRRVVTDGDLADLLASKSVGRDFDSEVPLRFTHRRTGDTDIYFVANQENERVSTVAAFRAGNRAPELWDPNSGCITRPAVYDVADGTVRLPLHFGPHGSTFVVFRKPAAKDRIVEVRRDGRTVLGTTLGKTAYGQTGSREPGSFSLAAWVKPGDTTTLHAETNRGVRGLAEKRNDVIYPPHGNTYSSDGMHAGAGLAVGRNGVCVFEHSANYFVPILVHAAPLSDWTHVTVVYDKNRPRLFLDGKPVHTGLQSRHTVHPGSPGEAGGSPFRGEMGPVKQVGRALDEAEVAQLAASMPRPGDIPAGPAIELTRNADDSTGLLIRQPGKYNIETADGTTQEVASATLPDPIRIRGTWQVAFDPSYGGPGTITLGELTDWTRHSDAAVRHYAGKATYRTSFDFAEARADLRWYLDLGELHDLAAIRLNGCDLGVVWLPPWRVEITDALRPASNRLEIDIVNVWNNRLIGDLALPPEKRRSFILAPTVKRNASLQPAGLLGPVTIQAAIHDGKPTTAAARR